jgi:hypothetical protein
LAQRRALMPPGRGARGDGEERPPFAAQ